MSANGGPPSSMVRTTDPDEMRRALACVPSVLVAVGAHVEGQAVVMVASSFTAGVSFVPPLVTFAVQQSSTTWKELRAAPRIGVSVLAKAHADRARQLASRDRRRRLVDVPHHTTEFGAVLLDAAPARLETSIEHVYPAGDHELVVLRVLTMHHDATVDPLVWPDS
ncbi:NADH-FMN oxidoreductase RutF, flavin reductase (DIM6/NTAB) family [Quadrisphaera granulorum]|uniref:Flavin reductase (DIM6/NTAB) family NADH-FMN oxidoreductase RutF n=1 Tax=Quadrisphaera granulorum TaxID=317664 RepID=A0A316ATV2_9ACTN|nr:flavin reductase family protein [Quadrisphaera granulorum]PWJ53617.1 flavin reductase (DIM6/NTAB) family NADH-FMN oxidoreductase RutF [Quadrisphaera granulorum]SZE96661.1 NADH-FMN oxidoreductase RutF, flavin reductase (DIM6/NTAB) family [Quadrisphaera granulorum]